METAFIRVNRIIVPMSAIFASLCLAELHALITLKNGKLFTLLDKFPDSLQYIMRAEVVRSLGEQI